MKCVLKIAKNREMYFSFSHTCDLSGDRTSRVCDYIYELSFHPIEKYKFYFTNQNFLFIYKLWFINPISHIIMPSPIALKSFFKIQFIFSTIYLSSPVLFGWCVVVPPKRGKWKHVFFMSSTWTWYQETKENDNKNIISLSMSDRKNNLQRNTHVCQQRQRTQHNM